MINITTGATPENGSRVRREVKKVKEVDLTMLTSDEIRLLIRCVQRCRTEARNYRRSIPYPCSEAIEYCKQLENLQVVLTEYAQSHGIPYTLEQV